MCRTMNDGLRQELEQVVMSAQHSIMSEKHRAQTAEVSSATILVMLCLVDVLTLFVCVDSGPNIKS